MALKDKETIERLVAEGVKVEPFNSAYVKFSRRRPEVDPATIKDPLDRFIAEGSSDWLSPFLVDREAYEAALSAAEEV